MLRQFSNLPIRVKILFTAGLLAFALIGLGAFSFVSLRASNEAMSRLIAGPLTQAEAVTKFSSAVATAQTRLYRLSATAASENDSKKIADLSRQVAATLDSLPNWLATITPIPGNDDSKSTVEDLNKAVQAYLKQAHNVVNMADKDAGSSLMFLMSAERSYGQIESLVSDARIAFTSTRDTQVAATSKQLDEQSTVLVVVTAIAVLLGGIMTYVVAGGIARPVVSIAQALRAISAGDLDKAIPGQGRRDEIGTMAAAVEIIKERLTERDRLERQTAEIHRQNADKLRQTEDAFRESGRAQAEAIERIGEALDKLARGDITIRIENMAGEYAKLATDFNKAATGLEEALSAVAGSTTSIRTGTRELHSASDDLAERTERQAASLEQTTAALERIRATVDKTAAGATHARDIVQASKLETEKVGDVTRSATEAMGSIENSSKQISRIIGVIDEIAFQTNLLALNAGVEAARAGDAGRGFAVVASEVRALAQRSAEAAKEIKGLIQASTGHVDRGVSLVAETGKALERIAAQVAEINEVVAEIAHGAQEQATGLQQVRTAVSSMDQVTQQNAAMVEQSTAATHTLSEQTDELVQLIARFRLSGYERRNAPREAAHAAPAAPVRLAARAPSPAPARTSARPMATMKTKAAARPAHTTAAAEDDWQNF